MINNSLFVLFQLKGIVQLVLISYAEKRFFATCARKNKKLTVSFYKPKRFLFAGFSIAERNA